MEKKKLLLDTLDDMSPLFMCPNENASVLGSELMHSQASFDFTSWTDFNM